MTEEPARPKISIVTPSFNQGHFIEEAIQSVLLQQYPNLEYVIIDGKSEDGSVGIIRKYEQQLTYWASEPDEGQYDAVNKGFRKTTGEIMAWINSDDKYLPWTFSIVAEIFTAFPEVEWLTTSQALQWDPAGRAVWCGYLGGFNKKAFFKGANLPGRKWYATGWIQQEATFWRRSLWEKVDSQIDASLQMAGDFDLWARFFHHTDLYAVSSPLGGFRLHGNQKTGHHMGAYLAEAEASLLKHGGKPCGTAESALRHILHACLVKPGVMLQSRLSSPVSEIIKRLPLLYPVKLLNWSETGWKLDKGYII